MDGVARGDKVVGMESVPLGEEGPIARHPEPWQVSAALIGDGTCIAQARHFAADFLTRFQAEHGIAVTVRTRGLTQLVVSELVTNALKYAPGPVLLDSGWWLVPELVGVASMCVGVLLLTHAIPAIRATGEPPPATTG